MNSTAGALVGDSGHLKEVPGDGGWPLVGYSLRTLRDPIGLTQERYARYGEVYWGNAFGKRFISMLGPDANQFVYQNDDEVFANAGWNLFLAKLFPRGLMLLDFAEHRMHRRIMQSAFRKEALATYLKMMQPVIATNQSAWTPGDGFLAYDRFKQLTLEVGSQVFVGESPGGQVEAINRAFFDTVQAATSLVRVSLPGTRWARGLRGRRLLERYFYSKLEAKRRDGGNDMFAEFCRAQTPDGEHFSDADIVNHMIFLLMAAHDTSTITLTNMVYQLARHPLWQERLREESRGIGSETLDHDALQRLTSMDLVMRETLRLVPPVSFHPRLTVRESVFKGFRIPTGSYVQLSPAFTHLMPELWSDPLQFDPERFAETRREDKRHPYAWVPFGGGAHKCIGMFFADLAVKTILHRMLLRFSWSVPADYRIEQDYTALPVPRDRLPISLQLL